MTAGGWVGVAHLMTPADVAEHLAVSRQTVARLRRSGRLRGTPVGNSWRFHPDDVAAFINTSRSDT